MKKLSGKGYCIDTPPARLRAQEEALLTHITLDRSPVTRVAHDAAPRRLLAAVATP